MCHETIQNNNNMYWEYSSVSPTPNYSTVQNMKEWDINYSSPEYSPGGGFQQPAEAPASGRDRRKRRRGTKTMKNNEEMENQRMTHIAGDQASIVAGAINYVKELEQLLQCLEAHKQTNEPLFGNFFTFPQYSTCPGHRSNSPATTDMLPGNQSAVADVEVAMVESHANIKVLSRRNSKQLLKMIHGFQSIGLTILHLNITTVDHMVLNSFSVKVEDDCELTTVSEIATAVHNIVALIQEETMSSW
ncbi:hypothetical protein LguiA_005320 [Lonicera macranthoides]